MENFLKLFSKSGASTISIIGPLKDTRSIEIISKLLTTREHKSSLSNTRE